MKTLHLRKAAALTSPKYKHILEFGVYEGKTIQILRNCFGSDYSVFGFDSFEGLPEDWISEDGTIAGGGLCKKNFFSTNGKEPQIKGINFYKGFFEDTIKEYIKIAEPICLLHIDCDLYSSTKTVLYGLKDYIVSGTIIVFDEWIYNENTKYNDHEQKCFYEWVKDFNRLYELIPRKYEYTEQQIVKILR